MSTDVRASAPSAADLRIRVLSYNIRHGQGVGGLLSNPRVARVIASADCDVAGLNEVWRVRRSYDQPRLLGELTGSQPVFHSLQSGFGREIGNLALVRGPRIASTREIALGGKRESRGCLVLDLEVSGRAFTVALVHLSLDRATRSSQLEMLAAQLAGDRPLLLIGDFNCRVAELAPLATLVTFPADVPPTYPSVKPFRALDHIGYSGHWALEELRTIPSWASDHRPLLAELRLVRTAHES